MSRTGLLCTAAVAALSIGLVLVSPAAGQGSAPQCSDGIDNDGDGKTDFSGGDPECVQNPAGGDPPGLSSDNSEAEPGYQAFGGTPPPDGGGGGGFAPGPCERTVGPATISNAFGKPGGSGNWEPYKGQCLIEFQEQPDPTGGTMRYLVVSFADQNGSQDLKSLYPQGSEISFDLTSSGANPLFVLGTGNDMLVDKGPPMTVQGKVPSVEFAFNYGPTGPDCAAGTQQMDFYGAIVQFESTGGGQAADLMNSYAGAVIGTNAQQVGFGGVSPDGSISADIQGCGTNLFYEATLPISGLALGGLTGSLAQALEGDLGAAGADKAQLTQLDDNNQQVPGQQFSSEFLSASEIAPQPTPGARRTPTRGARDKVAAVGINYRTGFSAHEIAAGPDEASVKKAKRAVKNCKRGKLVVKRGKLVCKEKD